MNVCRSLLKLNVPLQTLPQNFTRHIHCNRPVYDRRTRGTITSISKNDALYRYDKSMSDPSSEVLASVCKVIDKPEALNFAIIQMKGKQYKVSENDVIQVGNLCSPAGSLITLDKVLLCGSLSYTLIGRPLLPAGAVTIDAMIIEEGRGPHLRVFNFGKTMKRSRFWGKKWRKMFFHQEYTTVIRINKISVNKSFLSNVNSDDTIGDINNI